MEQAQCQEVGSSDGGQAFESTCPLLVCNQKKREVDGGVQLCLLFPFHSVLDSDLHIQGWFPFSGVAL